MAEGLNVTVTGKGVLGDLEPGWSEQEFATPINPNERAGGTGIVSFSANDVAAGVLAINKAAVSSYTPLGSVSGVVRTSSKTGQRIGVTHDNKLAQYNAVRNMPPMVAASVPGCLDLAAQMLGDPGFVVDTNNGTYWSLKGHAVGFDVDANIAEATTASYTYLTYNSGTTTFSTQTATTYGNYVSADSFNVFNNTLYADGLTGGSFDMTSPGGFYNSFQAPLPKLRIMGKTFLNGQDMTFAMSGLPSGPADLDYAQNVSATVDYSAATVTLSATYRTGGVITTTNNTFSIAALNLNQELAFRVYYTYAGLLANIPPIYNQIAFSVCNVTNFATVVEGNINFQPDKIPVYFSPWTMTGNIRAILERTDQGGLSDLPSWPVGEREDWETARTYAVGPSSTVVAGNPSIGFSGNIWDWLQDACTAYQWEIGLSGDVVTARTMLPSTAATTVSNFAASPTVTPTTTRTGRQVNIAYQNASTVSGGEVYDARSDDNRIITVNAAQETVVKIQSDAYLTAIFQPTRTTTFVPGAGTYYVIDSTGLPIVANQWEDFGGALSVAIDNSQAGTITVTLTGPREQIPSTTMPYSLAVSDGTNQYGALSILGSGVVADPQTLNLLTGANADITPQEVAFTVNQPFINTVAQAYDAGIWAAVDASGPRVDLSIVVPTSGLTGFGVTAGSLINIEDSTYRVTAATVGRTQTSIQAARHATVAGFDAAWNGETVADHDAVWVDYLCEDQRILTYLGSPAATLPDPVFPP